MVDLGERVWVRGAGWGGWGIVEAGGSREVGRGSWGVRVRLGCQEEERLGCPGQLGRVGVVLEHPVRRVHRLAFRVGGEEWVMRGCRGSGGLEGAAVAGEVAGLWAGLVRLEMAAAEVSREVVAGAPGVLMVPQGWLVAGAMVADRQAEGARVSLRVCLHVGKERKGET